ncbi:MAG: MaoC family dehydratase N-terminal domain-containing protein [Pseudomonadota bacterium]
MTVTSADFVRYVGMKGPVKRAHAPLEREMLRRFAQAIMDPDPLYFDELYARTTRYGRLVAPPLYPVHAFRTPAGAPDPLKSVQDDPHADGTHGNDGMLFGLEPIESPFKRLLNGGNEIEFLCCLAVHEVCTAQARYASVVLKEGKSGKMLLVDIETEFRNQAAELLLINRQTLIWR